jgi:hypothetical protein
VVELLTRVFNVVGKKQPLTSHRTFSGIITNQGPCALHMSHSCWFQIIIMTWDFFSLLRLLDLLAEYDELDRSS